MRKLILLTVTVLSLYSCTCNEWKYKRGDVVEHKLAPDHVLLVLDTITKYGQNYYKVCDQDGKKYEFGEFEIEADPWK